MQKSLKYCLLIGAFFLFAPLVVSVQAAIKLPAIIGDNMVLQQGQRVPIWGWADKGERVTVSIAEQTVAAKADGDGRWRVTLEKLSTGKPLEMIIKGSSGEVRKLNNILVGEVWLCSGQSNMEVGVKTCANAQQEIAAANYPQIRLFLVANTRAAEPAADLRARWSPCSPESVTANEWPAPSVHGQGGFSAVAYFFGRQLHKDLNVPVGLIDADWGGTAAEFWVSRKALEASAILQPLAQGEACTLYNGMIAPLIPFGIRGAIWYQGESNAERAFQYRTLFPTLIHNWRTDWGQGDFPFGFVQLAPFRSRGADPECWAELREAQLMTLKSVPNTGMAVTMDIGDVNDIHPKDKQDVGKRLALWARAKVYGQDIVYSGPIYKSITVNGNKISVQFAHVGGGLVSRDGKPLSNFTIAGADREFVPGAAVIVGDRVIVSSAEVAKPVAVRFAWRDDALPNLSNKEGLPASPFRTDSWKGVTEPEDLSTRGELLFENSDFEEGNLNNWTARGDAFDYMQPTKGDNSSARGVRSVRQQGDYWIGSYERYDGKTGRPGDVRGDFATGTLESVEFTITESLISFLISGGEMKDSEYVALVVEGKEVKRATGRGTETMRQVVWDVSAWKGKKAHILIADQSKAPWGFIDADDFHYFIPHGGAAASSSGEAVQHWAVTDPFYPKYHLTPPGGWMHDPHPFYFNGMYHLFYQSSFRRHDPYGGGHNWGHIVSSDLVHWKHMPIAIPAIEAERRGRHGIWSGCMVDNGGVATAIYTVDNREVWTSTSADKDLATFKSYAGNPILTGPPAGLNILEWTGFHDPWVWKEEDLWYMIIGCGAKDESGPILPLYKSADLIHWEYLHPLWERGRGTPFYDKSYDVSVECPTFFKIGGKHVLVLSEMSMYLVGRYEDHRFTAESSGRLDYYSAKFRTNRPGPPAGLFVPQITWDDKGRCLMWGWVLQGLDREAEIKAGWAGSQTLPRVVTMGPEGGLHFEPAEELKALRREHKQFAALTITPDTPKVLDGVQGLQYEVDAVLEPGSAKRCGFEFMDGATPGKLVYEAATKTLSFNDRSAPLVLDGGQLRLRIFVDAALVEVYANEKVCFSGVVQPASPTGFRFKLFAEGGRAEARKIDIWKMGAIW